MKVTSPAGRKGLGGSEAAGRPTPLVTFPEIASGPRAGGDFGRGAKGVRRPPPPTWCPTGQARTDALSARQASGAQGAGLVEITRVPLCIGDVVFVTLIGTFGNAFSKWLLEKHGMRDTYWIREHMT